MEIYFASDFHINSYIETHVGFSNTAKYKKFIDKSCLPADVLCLAGDIGNDYISISNFLIAASKMYNFVVYVNGFTELFINNGMTANDKLSRIDKFVKSKCRNVFRLNGPANLESLNVYTPKKIGELEIVGDSGFASSCFFNKVLNYDDEWKKSINFSDNYDVNKISEMKLFSLSNSVTSNTDIVISHYMPDYIKTDDNFSLYDHKLFSSKLKNGAILHCGHVHQKIKKEIKNKNGKFLLINNSIGFPNENLGKLNKNDFLINI